MSDFSSEWLALRAPYDAVSRSVTLARTFAAALPPCASIADLGAGSGANALWLAAHVRRDARFLLVDNEAALLPRDARSRVIDLAHQLENVGDVDAVVCSAFLDLVSAAWLQRLVAWLRGRPFLAALSVDGRIAIEPADPEDDVVLGAFRNDQRRDKGFGAALGGAAPETVAALLREAGYRVEVARSDWALGPSDQPMLAALIEGFAAVAPHAKGWQARRRDAALRGALKIVVGHMDVVGVR